MEIYIPLTSTQTIMAGRRGTRRAYHETFPTKTVTCINSKCWFRRQYIRKALSAMNFNDIFRCIVSAFTNVQIGNIADLAYIFHHLINKRFHKMMSSIHGYNYRSYKALSHVNGRNSMIQSSSSSRLHRLNK